MADNSNLVLEVNKRYLKENENSLLLESEVHTNVNSSISRNSAAELDNCSFGLANSSFESKCLTSTKNEVNLQKSTTTYGCTTNLSVVIASSEIKADNFQSTAITEKDHLLPSGFTADEETFKIQESSKFISISDSPNDVLCDMTNSSADSEEDFEGEEFKDSVQFFTDPSSLQYLDGMETSEHEEKFIPRNSLLMKFDPLLKAFVVPTCLTTNSKVPDKNSDISDKTMEDETIQVSESSENDSSIPLVPKPFPKFPARESFGNILLSFDSPLNRNSARNFQKDPATKSKLYTEEELQEILKINKVTIQEMTLKNQRELEEECRQKITEKDEVIKHHKQLYLTLQIAEELASRLFLLKEGNQPFDTIKGLESENQKLQDDLKTSNEDLQSAEHTFSDFHKRYVLCKDMLKTYKDNEVRLEEKVDCLNKQLEEKKNMYNMLQTRTEEMVSKANTEVANAKTVVNSQNALLKAQLKNSELKILSLENDLNKVKFENNKLRGICDDLMAKVSEC